jgi:hypothetical protein
LQLQSFLLQQEYKESATVAHQSFEHEVRKSNLKGVAWMQGFFEFFYFGFFYTIKLTGQRGRPGNTTVPPACRRSLLGYLLRNSKIRSKHSFGILAQM